MNNSGIENMKQEEDITVKWYFSRSFVIVILLTIGPFGIPFLIFSPRFSTSVKILLSLVIIVITLAPIYAGILFYNTINNPTELNNYLRNNFTEEQIQALRELLDSF
ncbi:MAG: hypothetical protein ACD_79C00335G0001, partial [uncultured bacterium]